MRKFCLVISLLALYSLAGAQLIFQENFTGYTVGDLNTQGGWVPFSSGGTPQVKVAAATPLLYTDYNAGGNYVTVDKQSAGTGKSHHKLFTTPVLVSNPATQTIYYSFLVRVSEGFTNVENGNYTVALRRSAGATESESAGRVSIIKEAGTNNWKFGISAATGATFYTTTSNSTSQVFLILVRYDMKPGAPDVAYLWVDPSLATEPAIGTAQATSTASSDAYGDRLDALMIFQRDVSSRPVAALDGFRVAVGTSSAAAFADLNQPACTAPGAQPTNLSFNSVNSSSLNGSFTAAASTNGYLVVRTSGAAPTAPVNGTTYTAGSSALGGVIVSSSTATTFSSTGLSPSTTYAYYVYGYNNVSCTDGPVYQTANPLNGSTTTTVAPMLLSDNFTGYSNGNLNGQGSWIMFTTTGAEPQVQVQNALPMQYSGYNAGGPYVSIADINAGTGRASYKAFTSSVDVNNTVGSPTQTIFYSFLVRINQASTTQDNGNYSVALRRGDGTTEAESAGRFVINKESGTNKWQFRLATGTTQSAPVTVNSTSTTDVFLIVIRYDMIPNANDVAYMWVNPSLAAEPNTASAQATNNSGGDAYGVKLDALMILQRATANRPAANFDAFRVAVGNSSAAAFASLMGAELPVSKKLAIIGSSTSACTGPSNSDSCYVNRLIYYYNTHGTPMTVNNLAVGGTDPYQAMPDDYTPPAGRPLRTLGKNITTAVNSNPNVILVNFPSNGFCTYSVAEVMNCFRIMKQAADNAPVPIPIYFTTTQPRAEGCYLASDVKLKMTQIKDSVLTQFGYYAVDFYTDLTQASDSTIRPEYNSGDNIHLNNAGHRILFQKLLEKNLFVQAPLPVKFISFSGYAKNNETYLTWKTATEENLLRYEVQRSFDGNNFTTLTKVTPHNTGGIKTYSYTDYTKGNLAAYYRIVAVDIDGKTDQTKLIRIAGTKQSFTISNVLQQQNKFILELQSNEKQQVTVQLYNTGGQVMYNSTRTIEKGITQLDLNISGAVKGLLLLNARTATANEIKKIWIQ